MTTENAQLLTRSLLTLVLLYFCYGETGWATALSLGLIFVGIEGINLRLKQL